MEPAIAFLEAKFKSKRQTLLVLLFPAAGLMLVLIGAGLFSWIAGSDDPLPSYAVCKTAKCLAEHRESVAWVEGRDRLLLAVFPLIPTLILLAFLWPVRSRSSPSAIRLMRNRAGDIVWVYVRDTIIRGNGATTRKLALVLAAGNRSQVGVPLDAHEVDHALALFHAALPHATVGYSAENEARYFHDPAALRRSATSPAMQAGSSPPQGGGGPSDPAAGARVVVAPHVTFSQLDQTLRNLGLSPESASALVAPDEPGSASWIASWGRASYQYDPSQGARRLELFAGDPAGFRARLLATGLPATPALIGAPRGNGSSALGQSWIAARSWIGIASLGATRSLVFRSRDRVHTRSFALEHGSVLLMNATTQLGWMHAVPCEPGAGRRMSLTFRRFAAT